MSEAKRMEIAPELVRQAQAGDEAAFNRLYEQTGTAIYRTIFSMVQNEDTAWDVHQNTYLLAWRGLQKLEKPEAFLPWLRRIAVNEAVKTIKKEEPLCFSELADDAGEEPQFVDERDGCQPEIELDKKESARLVREILDKLPQRQRLIVGMYYYEGYSVKEIAERLDVSQNTVVTEPTSVIRKNGTKWNGNLKFNIRPIWEIVEQRNAEELARAEQERRLYQARKLAEHTPGFTVEPAAQAGRR